MELPYPSFLQKFQRSWGKQQHTTVMGPTRCGKTWLCADLLKPRPYAVLLCVKGKDATIGRYEGWKVISKWEDRGWRDNHVVLWPPARTLQEAKQIRPAIQNCLEKVYVEGSFTMGLDDLKYLAQSLGLHSDLSTMYATAGSNDISLLGCGQSPLGIKVQEALHQSSHWLIFHQADDRNVCRMAEVSGVSRQMMREYNRLLVGRDFLWIQSMEEPVHVRR